jgi:hypothetical protein
MATEVLTDILNALPEQFASQVYHQFNRRAATIGGMNAVPGSAGAGRQVAFDVEFSGTAGATTVAEGSDVAAGEFASDKDIPATLSWATYRAAFQISEIALSAAMSSANAPQEMMKLFGNRVIAKTAAVAALANLDFWTEDGTDAGGDKTLVGYLGGALAATGTYANINRSTYSEWAGNVLANGGTPRALTMDLLAQAEEQIYEASGEDFTCIRTSPGVLRKYEGLFENVRREEGAGTFAAGATSFTYKGRPVYRDKDCTAGNLVFENTRYVEVKWLPHYNSPQDAVEQQVVRLTGQTGDQMTASMIPVQVTLLAKTGNSLKCMVSVVIASCVKRPNAFALVQDISEA